MEYKDFLKQKKKIKKPTGFHIDKEDINSIAFPFQKDIIQWAVNRGKAGVFADCGLGKTIMQGEWADKVVKHTGGNVLILAPLGVTKQTQQELKDKLGIESTVCRNQDDVRTGINITNYERLREFDTSSFDGVVLDESSILKNFVGKTKTKIVDAFKHTQYKLSLSGTPAPNDYLELLNQADFLDIMQASTALATWFINDMKTGEWRLKGHAVHEFWKWVSTWAVLVDKPSDLGYSDDGFILPKHNEITYEIDIDMIDHDFNDGLIRKVDLSATSFHREKRLTADKRAKKCVDIANSTDDQYIIWCDTNQEADLLKKYIPDATEVRGTDKPDKKEMAAVDFKNGKIRVLISKPKIFGYGMNFQNCHNAIFCGRTFSYEDYYQAVKRLLRFGQHHEVNSYTVIGSTEKRILEVVREKQQKQLMMKKNITNCIKDIQLDTFKGRISDTTLESNKINIPDWIERIDKNAAYFEKYRPI